MQASKLCAEIFLKKWSKNERVKPFLNYFESEYLNSRSGWYEGNAPGFPSTNNGRESLNNQIKEEGTLRLKLPLGEFFTCSLKLVKDWSIERSPESPNFKPFVTSPTLHVPLLSETYNFAREREETILTKVINDK